MYIIIDMCIYRETGERLLSVAELPEGLDAFVDWAIQVKVVCDKHRIYLYVVSIYLSMCAHI